MRLALQTGSDLLDQPLQPLGRLEAFRPPRFVVVRAASGSTAGTATVAVSPRSTPVRRGTGSCVPSIFGLAV